MKKRVMFVDDEPDQLFSFEQVLKHWYEDVEFIGVSSGEECFKELEKGELPDIIFLDIFMPGIDGWEVSDKLRNNAVWKNIPIIFLTTNTNMTTRHALESLGDGYLEKPVDSSDLIDCIKKILMGK